MTTYPFEYQGPIYFVYDDDFEVAYYSRDRVKYRRIRNTATQTWKQTKEERVSDEAFWCVVKVVEMRGYNA